MGGNPAQNDQHFLMETDSLERFSPAAIQVSQRRQCEEMAIAGPRESGDSYASKSQRISMDG
jgi:hypothetical protein